MAKECLSAHGEIMITISLIASDVGNTLTLLNTHGVNKWDACNS
jgi:hypothetical protein